MDGIKLIDASEVSVKKKTSKIEVEKTKSEKSPIKIITESGNQKVEGSTESDIKIIDVNRDDVSKIVNVVEHDKKMDIGVKSDKTIRALKLKQDIYYGEKNVNKKQFMKLYKKKELALRWVENTSIGGEIVNCWINEDRSQYIIKLPEEGEYKRFKFYGCDEIYNFFVKIGAIPFDYTKEIVPEHAHLTDQFDKTNVGKVEEQEEYEFIGADLWSGYRTRQLLKGMPDNWGVKWT